MAKKAVKAGQLPEESPVKRMGRPKGQGRISQRYAVVTSPEYRTWMTEFMEHLGESEVSDVFRRGIRLLAEQSKFREPPKR